MKLHKIELTGYCAKSPDWPALYLGTAGSYGNEQLAVTLGKGWDGLTVTATFQPAGVTVLVSEDGTLDVPWEATETALDTAKGRIVFEGVTDGRVLISTDIPYAVGSHSDTEGSNSQPPTPSQWEQFVDEVKADADRAEKAAGDAEATLQDVKNAGAQAVTDIGNAKDSALEAIDKAREEAAGSISADVEGAKQAAADAEQSAADAEQSAKDAADALANVQSAGQSALDDIATERQNTLSDIQNEGAKQQSAVAGAGTAALEAIGRTEQAAINQIKQTGETQVGAVQSAGTTQISQINSAGAAQVQAVKDEGATQTAALNEAAEAHKNELESIASHPPQPNTATGKWQVWNAETGAYQDTDALYQGGYYTPAVSDDGVLTWQGNLPEMPAIPGANIKGPKGDKGDPGLGVPSPTQSDAGKVPVVNAEGTGYELGDPQVDAYSKSESDARYAPLSAAIRPTASGNPVSITDSVEWPLQGLKVYGKSTQDGTPSPESPVPIVSAGASGSIEIAVYGEQLLDISAGTIRGWNVYDIPNVLKSGNTYTFTNVDFEPDVALFGIKFDESQTNLTGYLNTGLSHSFVLSDNFETFMLGGGQAGLSKDTKVMLNYGTSALPWQPFRSQSLTISTPNGLPGIPVDSGGNYTDAEGQQSACDVKDYGIGKYTQMVGHIESYNGENITTPYMSTTGQLSTGAEVYYVLDEPVVTDISTEELAAYRALHTYDGTTVVSTAEDVAGLEVRYVADAQKYIDNRLTAAESHIQEIAAAQLNAQTGG